MDDTNAEDVEAVSTKLPGGAVNTQDPWLSNLHPVDDQLGDGRILKVKSSEEALQTFVLGVGLSAPFKTQC